jgi:hypothetical protein
MIVFRFFLHSLAKNISFTKKKFSSKIQNDRQIKWPDFFYHFWKFLVSKKKKKIADLLLTHYAIVYHIKIYILKTHVEPARTRVESTRNMVRLQCRAVC